LEEIPLIRFLRVRHPGLDLILQRLVVRAMAQHLDGGEDGGDDHHRHGDAPVERVGGVMRRMFGFFVRLAMRHELYSPSQGMVLCVQTESKTRTFFQVDLFSSMNW